MKLKADIFLKAARVLENNLKRNSPYGGRTCCDVLRYILRKSIIAEIHPTPEFKLFKELFCNKRNTFDTWFGRASKWDEEGLCNRPHTINQKKRIAAMYKCYQVATKLNKRSK